MRVLLVEDNSALARSIELMMRSDGIHIHTTDLGEEAPLHLTGKEFQMLELLSLRKGDTVSKQMFLTHLYGDEDEPTRKLLMYSFVSCAER